MWHEMNDSHVSVVSLSTVLACQAYILFYSRVLPTTKPEDAPAVPNAVPAAVPAVPAITSAVPSTLTAAALAQQPAVLVRTLAVALPSQPGTATTVVVPAVSSAELDLPASRQRSDSIYSTMSVEEIEAASGEMIDCLFQDAAPESASEAGSEEEERESRLEQRGGFKFYAPYRLDIFS